MSNVEDQYTIIQKIGEGGMGTVYLAKDTMLDRLVAIKQLNHTSAEDASMGSRFQQEALALAKLNHPNITHLYAFVMRQDTFWMVMEYVEGKTLEDWLQIHNQIAYPLAASIAVQMLDGLQHAHKKGIIHRDMKPANVMINEEGEVKVMDFGIARMRGSQRVTMHGKSVGTLEYMAPEQIKGLEGDERTDVYAVGNIMYEMLCGKTPFHSDTDYQLMKDKLEKDPESIAAYNPAVPLALQKAILKALEHNPDKRYRNADEFKNAIQHCVGNELLSENELTQVLKASQVIDTVATGNEPTSVATILSRVKAISGNLKIPGFKKAISYNFHIPAIQKIKRPVIFLAAAVVFCIILLLWNSSSSDDTTSVENAGIKATTVVKETTPGHNYTEPEPTGNPSVPVTILEPSSPHSPGSVEETPAEMQVRIKRQQDSIKNANLKKKMKEPPKVTDKGATPDRQVATPPPVVKKQPVDVPHGTTIRLILSENFSSEDESRDGGALRFECAENIEADGRIIIRRGAIATGKIVDVVSSIRRKKALVGFVILKIQAVDGSSIKLKSERYRRQANVAGQPIAYKSGEFFTAKLGRGRVQ